MSNDTRLLTVTDYAREYPWPTVPAIRNYTLHDPTFPIHRVGRRVLIRPSEIDAWAVAQDETTTATA